MNHNADDKLFGYPIVWSDDMPDIGDTQFGGPLVEYRPRGDWQRGDEVKSIRCPKASGGCGRDDSWRIALDSAAKRLIADCTICGYRHSFPLAITMLTKVTEQFEPLDESGEVIRESAFAPHTRGVGEWDWRRMIPGDEYQALSLARFPGWHKVEGVPHSIQLEHIHDKGKSSKEIATEWDDLSAGCFYYRDITQSHLPMVDRGERYKSLFVFQFKEDMITFKSLFGNYQWSG
jgi:hypothetical protein